MHTYFLGIYVHITTKKQSNKEHSQTAITCMDWYTNIANLMKAMQTKVYLPPWTINTQGKSHGF